MEIKSNDGPDERHLFNIRIADPGINRGKYTFFITGATVAKAFRRIHVENSQVFRQKDPEGKDPAIVVVAPHVSKWDPPEAYFDVTMATGRTPRMIAADYTVDAKIPQDPKVLERTHKRPQTRVEREITAWCSSIGHPIPFSRSDEDEQTAAEIDRTITDRRQILMVTLQETRKKPWQPNPAKGAAARIALRHPDTRVFLMGITGMEKPFGPIRSRFGGGFTARELGIDQVGERKALMIVQRAIVEGFEPLVSEEAFANMSLTNHGLTLENRIKHLDDSIASED